MGMCQVLRANQGQEISGYATEEFLEKVASGVTGLDAQAALDGRDSAEVTSSIQASQQAAAKANVDSTPSFLVGDTQGQLSPLQFSELTPAAFTSQLDPLVEAAR